MTNPLAIERSETSITGASESVLWMWCPACDDAVRIRVGNGGWEWNGDLESVTVSPSILVQGGQDVVCHSFLRNGVWEFLQDCTHEMAGTNVPMVPVPDWLVAEGDGE